MESRAGVRVVAYIQRGVAHSVFTMHYGSVGRYIKLLTKSTLQKISANVCTLTVPVPSLDKKVG